MEDFRNGCQVAGEVALRSLGNTASTPSNEDILGQSSVGVFDLDEGELDAALTEVFD